MIKFNFKKAILNNQRFLVAFFPKGKKCISPVVATALLLVVAVVAVVSFQGWYQTFSSNLFVDVEQQGSIGNINKGIETIIDDSLYFRAGDETTISSVKIDGIECPGLNRTYSGMETLNVSSCITNSTSSRPEIVIVTDDKVLSKTVFLSENVGLGSVSSLSSSLSCNTDSDGNGFIDYLCANYTMTNTILEGHLDPNDSNSSVIPRVECVWNNNRSACESYFEVDGCGTDTVLDTTTGLCWDRNFDRNGTKTWTNAISYCDGLTTHPSGHSDWYLPTRQEFETIVDLTRAAPHIVGGNSIFQNVISSIYWTKTTYGPSTSYAFGVNLGDGYSSFYAKTSSDYVACVRRN